MFYRTPLFRAVSLVLPLLVFSQCATIVSSTRYPITISSVPAGATVAITDRNGATVYTGLTPAKVNLKAGTGYFKRGSYEIAISRNGYETVKQAVEFQFNGWYVGNLVFGGLIGFLIVDPLTGAMWTLPRNQRKLAVTLQEADSDEVGLRILNLNDVPQEFRSALVRIK